jgi:hypothetical protein
MTDRPVAGLGSWPMKHQQILDKLVSGKLVRAIDEDLRLNDFLIVGDPRWPDLQQRVLLQVRARWRCLLDADDATAHAKNVARVALATLLHKYGVRDENVTAEALQAIDDLNQAGGLSEAFERQSGAIKSLLRSAPAPRARRPPRPRPVTSLRPGDVVSIQLNRYFHAADVLSVDGDAGGTSPVIDFYEGRFQRMPAVEELARLTTGPGRRTRFGVRGLNYLPDPANQVVLIAPQHTHHSVGDAPKPGPAEYTATNILQLQEHIERLFGSTA